MRKMLHNIRSLRASILNEMREIQPILDAREEAYNAVLNREPDESLPDSDPIVVAWDKEYEITRDAYKNIEMRYDELDYLAKALKDVISHHVSWMYDHHVEGFNWDELGKSF